MKFSLRIALSIAFLAIVGTLASTTFGQRVGGYGEVDTEDAGVVAAADFAVETQAEKTQTGIERGEIKKAERQVVAGLNYRLCFEVMVDGSDASFAQAVVYVDLKGNRSLTSWTAGGCGGGSDRPMARTASKANEFRSVSKNDAGVGLAADFAVKERSKTTKLTVVMNDLVMAEDREPSLGTRDFRLCMKVNTLTSKPYSAQAVVSMDQYSNFKLVSWTEKACGETADDGFKLVEKGFTAGVDLAADFAVNKHSKDTSVPHKLVEILKREEKGMFEMTYRICMKVAEEGKTQTIQAIVSVDQYSNMKLISWVHSECGD